jgi:site-specific recombinase
VSSPVVAVGRPALLRRRIRLLVAATITYNVIEAVVAITAGTIASSIALGVITGVTPPVGLLAHPLVAVAGLVLGVAGVVVVLRMAAVVSGIALMAPAPIAVLAVVRLVVAVQIQVRVVEEPYLVRTHFSTPDRLVQ